jgi:hypothetical protein
MRRLILAIIASFGQLSKADSTSILMPRGKNDIIDFGDEMDIICLPGIK